MSVNSGEILFIKSVKDGIPNRDPLNESDARRVFGEEDGRISLSDVSIKRDVRDFVLAKYPDGGDKKRHYIFCRQERTADGKLLGRQKLAESILKAVNKEKSKNKRDHLLASSFDMRVFGVVYSVGRESFHQTGPVQFGWAHSLHPVETKYVQGTVVMPGKDIGVNDKGEQQGSQQGTIWTTYTLPFAVFAMPAVINAHIARDTGMDEEDMNLLLEGLWKGTMHRQARGRGIQQPLLLMHVEYKDPFTRIGYLEDYITLRPGREQWLGGQPPTALSEIELDITRLEEILVDNKHKISRVRYWLHPGLNIIGNLPGEMCTME
ncbi:CRISPR-associated protein Csh2 [Desulfohalotomaculum tongense]|uniref:CRISPR-associated protein n=1 Tax=Desulforadius tongensis TaxID=1216062 RepID=UPI00195D3D26|nr:type I CRISPR-associated protein Cas7 [Desulforadius tongensis]MBM7854027.1 CRISPR-associated protein Csh2 [Desulforadius tongensis]